MKRIDTRELLAQSFVELTRERGFNKVTVAAIAQNCGMSVRTFYNHFEDKYAVVNWLFIQANKHNFDNTFGKGLDFRAYSRACVVSFLPVGDYYQNLAGSTCGLYSVKRTVTRSNLQMFTEYLQQVTGSMTLDPHLAFSLDHYLRLNTDALFEWHGAGMTVPLDTIVDWTVEDMPRCLEPYLMPNG